MSKFLSPTLRATLRLWSFGFFQIPLLFHTKPRVLEIDDNHVVVKIPLTRKTKNHYRTMYFGALAIGADTAIGLLAVHWMDKKKPNTLKLVFKNFHAEFLKRPDGDVHFICEEGNKVKALVEKALATGERQTEEIHGYATVPSVSGAMPVARFSLGLSLKG